MLTRSQVRDNRQKWIDFLLVKGRKKATSVLDAGNGARCCLGHACYLFDERVKLGDLSGYAYGGDSQYEESYATHHVIEQLGLWSRDGESDSGVKLNVFKDDLLNYYTLADINDKTIAGPNRIGKYLQTVIEGGADTPFRPLSEYPEA